MLPLLALRAQLIKQTEAAPLSQPDGFGAGIPKMPGQILTRPI
jgi:hypothetical protein